MEACVSYCSKISAVWCSLKSRNELAASCRVLWEDYIIDPLSIVDGVYGGPYAVVYRCFTDTNASTKSRYEAPVRIRIAMATLVFTELALRSPAREATPVGHTERGLLVS